MIIVNNLNRSFRLDGRLIESLVSAILKEIKKPPATNLELVFLDNKAIRALNRRYIRRDTPTDVISFSLKDGGSFTGIIYISLDEALKNSRIFHTGLQEEAVLYIIHGILHLFGYNDTRPIDKRRMSNKEKGILKLLCRKADLSKALTRL
jgi:probable rRNA maturation factor